MRHSLSGKVVGIVSLNGCEHGGFSVHRGFVVDWKRWIADGNATRVSQTLALGRRISVPNKKTTHICVSYCRQTCFSLKRVSSVRARTVTGLKNVAAVRAPNEQSPTAFCTETRDCPTAVLSQLCNEIWKYIPTKFWLNKNWVKETLEAVLRCVEILFGTVATQMFLWFWMRHIRTFRAQ